MEASHFDKPQKTEVFCICRSADCSQFMISCDNCDEWYHGDCLGIDSQTAKYIDLFFCEKCRKEHSDLKITYKSKNNKRNKRKVKRENGVRKITLQQTKKVQSMDEKLEESNCKDSKVLMKDESLSNASDIFFGDDLFCRKAKIAAYQGIKSSRLVLSEGMDLPKRKSKKNRLDIRQCYGPGCTRPARRNSKYCSDECGVNLATNRILEILPQRIRQWRTLPCAADESSMRKLVEIRKQKNDLERRLGETESKIRLLQQLVDQSRNSPNTVVLEDKDDDSMIECKICGVEVSTRMAIRHMEACFKREDKGLQMTSKSLDDSEWNIFCNHRMGSQNYCKKLRVLCSLHYKDSKKTEDHCGYPLPVEEGDSVQFCGHKSRRCPYHVSWEELFRAQLDMEKLQLLLKMAKLEEDEEILRINMAKRGGLLNLMLHQTLVH